MNSPVSIVIAAVVIGAGTACLVALVAAGIAGADRLVASMLDDPARWMWFPALVGAAIGAAAGSLIALRRT